MRFCTHKMLVERGAAYLMHSLKCNPVFTERGSARNNEVPDVIGWNSECIVIECKITIEDLRADSQKPFRVTPAEGMGNLRYYLMPNSLYEELLSANAIDSLVPKEWGILVGDDYYRMIKKIRLKNPQRMTSNLTAERNYLRSRILEIQRFGLSTSVVNCESGEL